MNPKTHENTAGCRKYKLSDFQTTYYSPTEHLLFETIMLFKIRVIFKQYVAKKQNGLA
jgi:hypothetical protein